MHLSGWLEPKGDSGQPGLPPHTVLLRELVGKPAEGGNAHRKRPRHSAGVLGGWGMLGQPQVAQATSSGAHGSLPSSSISLTLHFSLCLSFFFMCVCVHIFTF